MRPRRTMTPPGVPLLDHDRKRALALAYYRELIEMAVWEGDVDSGERFLDDLFDEGVHLGEERARAAARAEVAGEIEEMRYLLEAAGRRYQKLLQDTRRAVALEAARDPEPATPGELTYHLDGAQA